MKTCSIFTPLPLRPSSNKSFLETVVSPTATGALIGWLQVNKKWQLIIIMKLLFTLRLSFIILSSETKGIREGEGGEGKEGKACP